MCHIPESGAASLSRRFIRQRGFCFELVSERIVPKLTTCPGLASMPLPFYNGRDPREHVDRTAFEACDQRVAASDLAV